MNLPFFKFHGTGNDFIIVCNRDGTFIQSARQRQELVSALCKRHIGIGADGLILVEEDQLFDFRMIYFNADGKEGSFCGNGGRCVAAYAHMSGFARKKKLVFRAFDGKHTAEIVSYNGGDYTVSLGLNDTAAPRQISNAGYFVDTGSPHLVLFNDDISAMDAEKKGREIRNSPEWTPGGVNVTFAQIDKNNKLRIRTYERGVEHETLSCGTGVVAAALAAHAFQPPATDEKVQRVVDTPGGRLKVSFAPAVSARDLITDIRLSGPATFVFRGEMNY